MGALIVIKSLHVTFQINNIDLLLAILRFKTVRLKELHRAHSLKGKRRNAK
jgi:hypothetical protein